MFPFIFYTLTIMPVAERLRLVQYESSGRKEIHINQDHSQLNDLNKVLQTAPQNNIQTS